MVLRNIKEGKTRRKYEEIQLQFLGEAKGRRLLAKFKGRHRMGRAPSSPRIATDIH